MARNRSKRRVSRSVTIEAEVELAALLTEIAPKATDEKRALALQRIMREIDSYLRTFPIANGAYRERSGLSDSRSALKQFQVSVVMAESDRAKLPYLAKRTFCQEHGPLGGLATALKRAAACADAAIRKLDQIPDKNTDDARIVLTAGVGRALKEMGLARLSLTDPNVAVNGSRGGAAYGRVIQLVLRATGKNVTQIRPLLRSGLELLESD